MDKKIKTVSFEINGKAKAKQSVRSTKWGKYTPKDMVDYANWVKLCFIESNQEHTPDEFDGYALQIRIDVYFRIPVSMSKKKAQMAKDGYIRPCTKPDWDNISKNICDALNGIAYTDDKCIVDGEVHKHYAEYEKVKVTITGTRYE